MEWQKSPDGLAQTFGEALPDDPRVERRKMFGYPAAFVNGNMFAGLHGPNLVVRLPEDARDDLLAVPGARIFEPMAGRPMREYVVTPSDVVADSAVLRAWLTRALTYASSLPPKSKEKRTKAPTKRRTGTG